MSPLGSYILWTADVPKRKLISIIGLQTHSQEDGALTVDVWQRLRKLHTKKNGGVSCHCKVMRVKVSS